ncbi:helix-turn-helix domain-containing protein [Maricaulis sp.]|uniref:helix-turn-helix domain-containing protein n=1 Tax=Maricaulis sp. TaxID=1486257 RepID=UPI0026104BFF|nr:helix-turn-helix domain-containing protein [Maricaulis sp.]
MIIETEIDWPAKLKELRYLENLKQEALAAILGYSQGAVSQWERGVRPPPLEIQDWLRKKLQASPSNRLRRSLERTIQTTNGCAGLFAIRDDRPVLADASPRSWTDFRIFTRDDIGEFIGDKAGEETAAVHRRLARHGMFKGEIESVRSFHASRRNGVEAQGLMHYVPFRTNHKDWMVIAQHEPMTRPDFEARYGTGDTFGMEVSAW